MKGPPLSPWQLSWPGASPQIMSSVMLMVVGEDDEDDEVYEEKAPASHGVFNAVVLALLRHAFLVAQDCLSRLPASTLKPKICLKGGRVDGLDPI